MAMGWNRSENGRHGQGLAGTKPKTKTRPKTEPANNAKDSHSIVACSVDPFSIVTTSRPVLSACHPQSRSVRVFPVRPTSASFSKIGSERSVTRRMTTKRPQPIDSG